jgi:hypothetical protein
MARPLARCGTPSGYRQHQQADEKPCDACARSKSDYDARRRDMPEQRLRSRIRAKAQFRAYQILARKYKKEYQQAYEAELVRVREEFAQLGVTETEGES